MLGVRTSIALPVTVFTRALPDVDFASLPPAVSRLELAELVDILRWKLVSSLRVATLVPMNLGGDGLLGVVGFILTIVPSLLAKVSAELSAEVLTLVTAASGVLSAEEVRGSWDESR